MVYWYQRVRRKARRAFSRSEWLRRILGEPVSRSTAHEPGILLIQIDGLSFRQFERAVSEGDERTLVVLETTVRPCYKKSRAIDEAIKNLRSRLEGG